MGEEKSVSSLSFFAATLLHTRPTCGSCARRHHALETRATVTRSCADRNERQRRSTSSESDPSSERIGNTVDRVSGIASSLLLLERFSNPQSALECERHFGVSSDDVGDRRLRSLRRKRTHLLDLYLSLV